MANRKGRVSLAGLVLVAILMIFSPQMTILAAEEFDLTDKNQWDDRLIAQVDNSMNIRSMASRSSQVIGKLKKNEIAEVLEPEKDGWTKIRIGELEGYVSADYTITGEEAYAYAMENGCMAATVVAENAYIYETAEEALEAAETNAVDIEEQICAKEGEQLAVDTEAEEIEGIVAVLVGDETCYVKADEVNLDYQLEKVRPLIGFCTASEEEIKLLAALLECEAGGTSYEGLLAVASVVMNRIESELFPNDLYEVIYQKSQFTPAMNGKVKRVMDAGSISEDAYAAAVAALGGERNTDCLFFQCAAHGHRGTKIGGNVFF